ncbi:MAG: hypothetical protein GXY63_03480 [Spirochaetales bacterium]|jgi:hypothetical protein|nr:hypothetical protein [Spirochaetota bacterium]NLV60664.1 hypothetical protein [Spirochaetales bacterium]
MNRSFSLTIDGTPLSAITIASQEAQLPSYLVSGEKQPGYLWDGEHLTRWYWKSLSLFEGTRVLTFEALSITPLSQLSTTLRDEALTLVRRLAEALLRCDAAFLDLSSGIIPLWRLWVTDEGEILIMSQDIGDLFSSVSSDEERYLNIACWVHHTVHAPFSLIDQMTSLLYYSAVGTPPFADRNSREDGFRHLPLSMIETGLDERTVSFIDETLSMSLAKMREASGNKLPHKALSAFLEQSEELVWNLEAVAQVMSEEARLASPKAAEFAQRQATRANAKIFWRKFGWIIITVALSLALVTSFVVGRVKESLAPPYTATFDQEEIIKAYYAAQNELDIQKMDAALARKVKNPSTMEVTNLFVTRQTRQAYESINVQVDPVQWIEEGMPPILEGAFIYGVSDVAIERLDEHSFIVHSTYWAPYNYEGETEEGPMAVYAYDMVQRFSIEMGKKGWYEITQISAPEIANMRRIEVATYTRTTLL